MRTIIEGLIAGMFLAIVVCIVVAAIGAVLVLDWGSP